MEFKLHSAIGHYIIVEPADTGKILKTEETATIFKIVSAGLLCEDPVGAADNEYIIVAPNSVETTFMGDKKVYFIRSSDVLATVHAI